jgi:curved DNA-binding protein CbpA
MAIDEQPIERLKKAYRVLDVPQTASALAIKSNYRKLIKRWHPDKPATSAATTEEATMMTKLINEAYSLIENAPLRYYAGNASANATPASPRYSTREKSDVESLSDWQVARIQKRAEYAVRIICGLLAGSFVGFLLLTELAQRNTENFSFPIIFALLFGAGALRVGDKAWREIFGIWWKWQ